MLVRTGLHGLRLLAWRTAAKHTTRPHPSDTPEDSDVNKHGIFKHIPSSLHVPWPNYCISHKKFDSKFEGSLNLWPEDKFARLLIPIIHPWKIKRKRAFFTFIKLSSWHQKLMCDPSKRPHLKWRSIQRQGMHMHYWYDATILLRLSSSVD